MSILEDKYQINVPVCTGPNCISTAENINKFQRLRDKARWGHLINEAVILRLCQRIQELEEQLNA